MKKSVTFLHFAIFLFLSLILIVPHAAADTGGPDDYGYVYIDSNESDGPEYFWEDIESSLYGNDLEHDAISGAVGMYFEDKFEFYGKQYSEVYIGSNGFLTFATEDERAGTGCCSGDDLPNSRGLIKNMIAGLWDDLEPGG